VKKEDSVQAPEKLRLRPAILESPYAGDIRFNTYFAQNVARRLLFQGWNCLASHLYYPAFLNEHDLAERQLGIEAGLAWAEELIGISDVFFALHNTYSRVSNGMMMAYERHLNAGRTLHCMICELDGSVRHNLPHAYFFHPEGWSAGLKQWALSKVSGEELDAGVPPVAPEGGINVSRR
jgi:hypothetical protein